jgi:hypothetical protein
MLKDFGPVRKTDRARHLFLFHPSLETMGKGNSVPAARRLPGSGQEQVRTMGTGRRLGRRELSRGALMWQWSGGGGSNNGYGDFDQIDVNRTP